MRSTQGLDKISSEESLTSVSNMASHRNKPSALPGNNSHRTIPQVSSHPWSGEQMDKERISPTKVYRPQSPSSLSRRVRVPTNKDSSQRRSSGEVLPPEEANDGRGLGRSRSMSRDKTQKMKPEKKATQKNTPGFLKPHFDNKDISFAADVYTGDTRENVRPEIEDMSPTHGVQRGSHQGPSRPRSPSTEFTSEGSSTAVPEAQMCVYIIKQGTSHAIPHRLEPGLRDTVNNALRLRPSQKSVYKKVASLSPENIAALQAVLDDGGTGPQTRRLVQLSILQKSRFQIGSSKDATVLAIVEDLYPQRPWRDYGESIEENEDNWLRRPSYPGPPPPEQYPTSLNDRFGPRYEEHLGFSGRARLVKRRLHRDVQDVSTDLMHRDDYQAAMTTCRVWIIQQHPSLKQRESEPQNWTRCTVTEDVSSQDDIVERLHALDKKAPSVNIKRLSLRPDQQTQISRLHETVINDEKDAEYQWSLRQLDLIRSKSKPFQLVPVVTAILVYLARNPRSHVNAQRLFEMQQMHEVNGRQAYFPTAGGAQRFSAHEPSPHLYNHSPHVGPPMYRPNVRIRSPRLPPWDHLPPPPLPPDAPYNPHGPPAGFPPPPPPPPVTKTRDGSVDRRSRMTPPPRPNQARRPRQTITIRQLSDSTDSDSDSTYEDSMYSGQTSNQQPKKRETRLIARLVSKRVLSDLGYPWREEGHFIIILKDLDEDQVDEILKLSEDRSAPEGELRSDPADQDRPRGNTIDDDARVSALQLKAVGRQDRSFERVRLPNDEHQSLAVRAANATDHDTYRRLPYQERSLLHDSKLRRKPSDMHLRSSAIARLGIPEAEARVALEATRVLGDLEGSVSVFNLPERPPFYPSQFDNMPHDPQRNADDQIINQLLVEWTPQGAGVTRGNEAANTGTRPEDVTFEEPSNFEGNEDLSKTSAADDEDYESWGDSSDGEWGDWSSLRGSDSITKTLRHGTTTGAELQDVSFADQDARDKLVGQEEVKDEAALAWETDSAAEIARLEERLTALKSLREGKKADEGVMGRTLDENTEQGVEQTHTQTQSPAAGEQDNTARISSPPTQPTVVQRRVTMDEVQDEADTRDRPKDPPPAEAPDRDNVPDKPARASTFPKAMKTSEAELQWAQRLLEDSTAFSEPAGPARAEIVFESPSRRSARAAQRQASKRNESGRARLRKASVE